LTALSQGWSLWPWSTSAAMKISPPVHFLSFSWIFPI
jgi:hypothetical protein